MLGQTHHQTSLTGRFSRQTPLWTILNALWLLSDALRRGLAAYREYEHLSSRNIPHDRALRQALGSPGPSTVAPSCRLAGCRLAGASTVYFARITFAGQ